MTGLGLRHHERVPLPGQPPEVVGLRARDVDRAFPGELLVVEVEDLVGAAIGTARVTVPATARWQFRNRER
jgi:hypothetical protein